MYQIPYEGIVIRPPSEADSLIFQLTLGCSDNKCTFCPAYKEKRFAFKDIEALEDEIRRASAVYPGTRKIFFADGDAITVERDKLIRIFEYANRCFPALSRIAVYGSIKSLEQKSIDDLRELKKRKLGIVYMGFETGDEEVYKDIKKYGSPEKNTLECLKVKEAGIKTNVTVILGLGGRDKSRLHAVNTAKILNEAQPHQIAALTLMIAPNTPLYGMAKKGGFKPLENFEFLEELKMMLEHIADFRCLFFSNHASNYYPVSARFPKDRHTLIRELTQLIAEKPAHKLTPESFRGL